MLTESPAPEVDAFPKDCRTPEEQYQIEQQEKAP